jgi:hypothetical protein
MRFQALLQVTMKFLRPFLRIRTIGRGIEADIVVYDGLISSQGFWISHILVLRRLRLEAEEVGYD